MEVIELHKKILRIFFPQTYKKKIKKKQKTRLFCIELQFAHQIIRTRNNWPNQIKKTSKYTHILERFDNFKRAAENTRIFLRCTMICTHYTITLLTLNYTNLNLARIIIKMPRKRHNQRQSRNSPWQFFYSFQKFMQKSSSRNSTTCLFCRLFERLSLILFIIIKNFWTSFQKSPEKWHVEKKPIKTNTCVLKFVFCLILK